MKLRVPWARREGIACIEMVELASDYLEGGLTASLRRRCREHIEGCDACRAFLDQLSKTVALLSRSVPRILSPADHDRLLAIFRSGRSEPAAS